MRRNFQNADLDFLPAFAKMVGPKPPDWFESNGCSRSPDVLFGVDLRPAAHWHDWGYSLASVDVTDPRPRTEQTRYERDQEFLANIKTCGLRRPFRAAYYYRLRLWGHFAYEYTPGFEPNRWSPRFWLGLFFGRYVTW